MNKWITLVFVLLTFNSLKGQLAITTFPYFEGFEQVDATGKPVHWLIYNEDGESEKTWSRTDASSYVCTGRYAMRHDYAAPAQNDWLVSPEITLPAGVTYQCVFRSLKDFYGYDNAKGKYSVWISTSDPEPTLGNYTEIWSSVPGTDLQKWEEVVLNLSDYAGQSVYVAFRYEAQNYHIWCIDDVSVVRLFDIDTGVTAITAPESKSRMTASESVTITVNNFGIQPLTAIPVTLEVNGSVIATESVPGTVNAQQEVVYTFTAKADLTAVRTHQLKAYTGWNADQHAANDTVEKQITNYGDCSVAVFPYSESFEDAGSDECWTIYNEEAEAISWIKRTWVSAVHTGIYNFVGSVNKGWLVSPKLLLETDKGYELSFWSYNRYNFEYEKNSVWISDGSANPADGNFVEIWSPASVKWDWEQTALDLSDYAGKEVYIAFRYEGYGHEWCLDDVGVVQLSDSDVGVTSILRPVSGKNLTDNEPVEVTVRNFSSKAKSGIPILLEINGAQVASETISGPVPAQSEINYLFTKQVDLSAVQSYTLKACTALGGDENPENNGNIRKVTNLGTGIVSVFPYTEGFEDDDVLSLWTQEKDAGNIAWDFRKGDCEGIITTPHSGERNANFYSYSVRGATKLVTPPLHLNALQAPVLKFWYVTEAYYGVDILKVYYKNAANASWTLLFEENKALSGWTEKILALPDKSGDYYIAFEGNAQIGNGILLDDVTVCEAEETDIALEAITRPVSGANLENAEEVTIRLKNMGRQNLNSVPVCLKVNGQLLPAETLDEPVATFEEITYTFRAKADLSEVKTHTIEVWTDLPGDAVRQNDSLSVNVTNYGNKAIIGTQPAFTTCSIAFVDDGDRENNYSPSADASPSVTFYPAETGKRVRAVFERFATVPFDDFMGLVLPGDSLVIYDGNRVDEDNRVAVLVGDLNANLPAPVVSHAPDGSLTFLFKKQSLSSDEGWEALIDCVDPVPHDAGVKRILSPLKGGNSAAEVKVLLKNYGGAPITSMEVVYNDVSEHFTGNIPPGETTEFTFNTPVDLSEIREDYRITTYTVLADDGDHSNDTVSVAFAYRAAISIYGYRFSGTGEVGVVSFDSNHPETLNLIHNYTDNGHRIIAGEQAGDSIYAYSVNVATGRAVRFLKLTKNWEEITSVLVTEFPSDLAYNYTNGKLYAITFDQNIGYEYLNEVNLATGQFIPVGLFPAHFFIAIACSKDGHLYGISNTGVLCAIHTETAEVTEIVSTGWASMYYQSMAFDHDTGRLFWAMTGEQSHLIELDPVEGRVNDLGKIDGNAELVALYIPYKETAIGIPDALEAPVIFPNPSNGWLSITSVPEKSTIRILDISGRLIQSYPNRSGRVELNLNLKSGIYFVRVEWNGESVIKKLIIKQLN